MGWEGARESGEPTLKVPGPQSWWVALSPSPPGAYPESGLTSQGAGEWEGTGQLKKTIYFLKKLKNNANMISPVPKPVPCLPPTSPGLGLLLPGLSCVMKRKQ